LNFRPSHDCRFFFSGVIEPVPDAPGFREGRVDGIGNDNGGFIVTDEVAPVVDGAPNGEVVGTAGVMVKFACIEGAAIAF